MVIGISGKIGSGKDTVGKIIQYLHSGFDIITDQPFRPNDDYSPGNIWQIKKYADKLKECVSLVTGIPREDLENIEVKNSSLGPAWDDLHVRTLLQLFGTEMVRAIHPDAWVNALFCEYQLRHHSVVYGQGGHGENVPLGANQCYPDWIITDMRFPNELKAVKDAGGITIRVNRGDGNTGVHLSETALDNAEFDYVIDNNGTIEELIKKVDEIIPDQPR